MGAEVALPTVDPRQRVRVAGVVAVAHIEPASGVPDGSGEAPDDDRHRTDEHVRATGDATCGALHAEQAVEAGRNPDRSTTVPAGRDRHEPARNGGSGPA